MSFAFSFIRYAAIWVFTFASIIFVANLHRIQYATVDRNPAYTHKMIVHKNTTLLAKVSEVIDTHKAAHYLSEHAEDAWRNSRFHNDINNLAEATRIKVSDNKVTYVYVHVPRTAGDSLQTHLFPIPEEQTHVDSAWWGSTGVPDLVASLNYPKSWKVDNYKRLYKGFWSRDRVINVIKNATIGKRGTAFDTSTNTIKMFTILRHPHERICSNYKFFKAHGVVPRAVCNVNKNKNTTNKQDNKCCPSKGLLIDYLKRVLIKHPKQLEKKRSCPLNGDEWKMKSFMDNEMAYQLGNIMEAFKRDVKPKVALERGKNFLDMMDFIGFYEDWNTDFHRLKHDIFHDLDSEGNTWIKWFRQEIFFLGTFAARNRMRTLKYSGGVHGETRTLMEEATKFDMEIYKYARRKMGRSEDGGLFKSYNEWLLKEAVPFGAFSLILLFICCRYCTCLCCTFCQEKRT